MSDPVQPATARDELRHAHETDDLLWSESYYLDFVDEDRGIGGYVRFGILPNLGTCWYWACITGPDRSLVTVIDHDAALPRPDSTDIDSAGIASRYVIETPLEHVSLSVEARAVRLDDPADTYGDMRGDQVGLALDLEWETDGGTFVYPGVDRYEVPSRVHGSVVVDGERIAVDGWGQRDHSWGNRDWWSISWCWTSGWLEDGTRFHGTGVDLGGDPVYGTGYVQPPGGPMQGTDHARHTEELGDAGLPTRGTFQLGDLELEIEPVAWAPVLLTAPDGRISRFPRAWTRFRTADGRRGLGWTEWNQPQG